jgi:hypothetical protein
MQLSLARYFGIPELADNLCFWLHNKEAALLYRLFNWSMFKSAKTHALLGYAMILGYDASAFLFTASRGIENLLSNENIPTAASATALSIIYGRAYFQNFMDARRAEARENDLKARLMQDAFPHEVDLLRDESVGQAPWYLTCLPTWYTFMRAVGTDMSNHAAQAMLGFATLGTICIYGPPYLLKTGYGSSCSIDNNMNDEGGKNEK